MTLSGKGKNVTIGDLSQYQIISVQHQIICLQGVCFPDLRHGPPDVRRERRVDVVDVHLKPLPPLLLGQPLIRLHRVELGLEAVQHLGVWERANTFKSGP